jgi:DNA-binding IclR family transcriptional regulator
MHQPLAALGPPDILEKRIPRIGTVAAAVAILRLLASERRGLGVNAVARQLSLTPSSCFNILKTLTCEQVTDFDPETKLYTLGAGAIAIARHALDPEASFDLIRNRAEALAAARSLTIGLWRVSNERITLAGYVAGSKTMRIHLSVGQRLPMLMGAIGRCVAANSDMTPKQIAQRFPELRWEEAPSLADYLRQVEDARRRQWGIDRGNFIRGATTLATPIFHKDGTIRYGLTATMFSGQYEDKDMSEIAADMIQIARWASSKLFAI